MAAIGSDVSRQIAEAKEVDGKAGSWFWDAKAYTVGMLLVLALAVFWMSYQQMNGHAYGMDSHDPVFDSVWMRLLYIDFLWMGALAVGLYTWLIKTRDRAVMAISPRLEMKRYFYWIMWLGVYTWAVYFAASLFAEQDAAWHQIVLRDTSFTPSHIVLFYGWFPMYIILGVAAYIYAVTRLPLYAKGVSIPLVVAVVGPFMIMPNVGLNEWGHAFWFMEEFFTAPLHWGFVVLGWSALGLGGVLVQVMFRMSQLTDKVYAHK